MLHQLGRLDPGPCRGLHQPRVWPRPQQQDQHRRRAQQARYPAHRPPAGAATIREQGLQLVGLHMHIGSGVDYGHPGRGVRRHGRAGAHGARRRGHDLRTPSAGGGLSIPTAGGRSGRGHAPTLACGTPPASRPLPSWATVGAEIEQLSGGRIRVLLGPGRATKDVGSNHFVLVDTGFNELMRPLMYGSFHAMSVVRRDGVQRRQKSPRWCRPAVRVRATCSPVGDGGVVPAAPVPAAQAGRPVGLPRHGGLWRQRPSNYNTARWWPRVLVDGASTA